MYIFGYVMKVTYGELHGYMSVLENSQNLSKHSTESQLISSASK